MISLVRLVGYAALLVALSAGRSLGQRAMPALSCDSVVRAARVDSIAVTARGYLLRVDGGDFPARAREAVLESILDHLVVPRPLALPVFSPGPVRTRMLRRADPGDSITAHSPVLYGAYFFTISGSGVVGNISNTVETLSPAFDASVRKAIALASGDSLVAVVARGLGSDSLALELRVSTGPEDPRLRVPPAPLFSAMLPVVRLVDAKPSGVLPLPVYPEDERGEGQDGEALLRGVVDQSGNVVVSTMEVQHATSSSFALSAALTFARYHFAPAHIQGCTVPQVVQMPFWFSLRP